MSGNNNFPKKNSNNVNGLVRPRQTGVSTFVASSSTNGRPTGNNTNKNKKLSIINEIMKKYNTNNTYSPKTLNVLKNIKNKIKNGDSINYYINRLNIKNVNSFENVINKIARSYYTNEMMKTKNRSKVLTNTNIFTNSNFSNSNLNKNEILNNARKNLKNPPLGIKKNKNSIEYYKKKINLRNSNVNNRNNLILEMSDSDYKQFLVNVYKDMIHDKILEGWGKEKGQYFMTNILPHFTTTINKNNYDNEIKKISKEINEVEVSKVEKSAGINLNKIFNKENKINKEIKNILEETLYTEKNVGVCSDKKVLFKKGIDIIYDSDIKGVIYDSVIKPNKNIRILYTPISSLNKGANLLPKPFCTYRENRIRGYVNRKIFKIKTSPSTFIIQSNVFKTVIQTSYVGDKIDIYLNGKRVTIGSKKNVQDGPPLSKIGKFLGDFIQILTCLLYTKNGKDVCFATGDKHAASMFIFLSKYILKNIKSFNDKLKEANRSLPTTSNFKKRKKNLKKQMPKIIFLRQNGILANVPNLKFNINFYNLEDYLKEKKIMVKYNY